MTAPLELLAGLVLEDGRGWWAAATPEQRADAQAVFGDGPRRHWLGRSRGYSKTTDAAAFTIAAMLTDLRPGSTAYACAADADQARLLVNAIRGFVERTPELRGSMTIQANRVIANDVVLEVLAADGPSAFGLTPEWLVIDELCQWSGTQNAKTFYEAITTALPKVATSRCIVISTAGSPGSFQHREYKSALESRLWRVSEIAGPPPWMPAELVEEERRRLLESSFRRWFENEWVASEDALASVDDIEAAVTHEDFLDPVPGTRYVVGVDIGLRRDPTAALIAHADTTAGPNPVVIVDRVQTWQGTPRDPVDLIDVETWLTSASRTYNRARVQVENWQGSHLVLRLKKAGVRATEVFATQQGSSSRATSLHLLLRDRRIRLPRHEPLLSELQRVVLRETGPYAWKIDHRSGEHNDLAIALGLAVEPLLVAQQRVRITRGFSTRDPRSGPRDERAGAYGVL